MVAVGLGQDADRRSRGSRVLLFKDMSRREYFQSHEWKINIYIAPGADPNANDLVYKFCFVAPYARLIVPFLSLPPR